MTWYCMVTSEVQLEFLNMVNIGFRTDVAKVGRAA
jgi:hypothetical protein